MPPRSILAFPGRAFMLAAIGLAALTPFAATARPAGDRDLAGAPVMTAGVTPTALRGVWRSRGYGWILRVGTGGLELFNETAADCARDPAGTADILDALAGEYRLSDPDHMTLRWQPGERGYRFERIAEVPGRCLAEPARDPLAIFDSVTATLSDQYPAFDRRGVDWRRRVRESRAGIGPATSERALFDSLAGLIRPLRDSHLTLTGQVDGAEASFEEGAGATLDAVAIAGAARGLSRPDAWRAFSQAWRTSVTDTILQGRGRMAANRRIYWGFTAPGIGYLNVVAFYGIKDGAGWREEQAIFSAALDEALADLKGADAVILDLSGNRGGSPAMARDLASRFATRRALAFTVAPAADREGGRTSFYSEPADSPHRFSGPVYVLTSDMTVSSGEAAVNFLRVQPNVLVVGGRTRGSLSGLAEKRLANGWVLEYPNEIVLDAGRRWWEGRGIPPQEDLAVYSLPDPVSAHAHAVAEIARRARACPTRRGMPRPCRQAFST